MSGTVVQLSMLSLIDTGFISELRLLLVWSFACSINVYLGFFQPPKSISVGDSVTLNCV